MANWILKFISGKYQGGEFQLEEGVVYGVGRANDSDMVLVEDMVSRNHAKIQVVGDVPILEDLGSTNGSFVNGERVKKVELKEGDRILFGTSIIRLVRADELYANGHDANGAADGDHTELPTDRSRNVTGPSAPPPTPGAPAARTMAININQIPPNGSPLAAGPTLQPTSMPPQPMSATSNASITPPPLAAIAAAAAPPVVAPVQQQAPTPAAPAQAAPTYATGPRAPMQTVAKQGGLMAGLLEEISLPDLLQLFSTGRKSGTLRVESEQNATLHIREGRVAYAEIHGVDLHPEKAAYRILTWVTGTFMFEAPVDQEFPITVDMGTEALMMETFRISDEISQLRNVPDRNQALGVSVPLLPPLRALNPEILDTLQLVINHSLVGEILDRSLANDLETLQDLIYLMQHQYVRPI